MRRGGEGRGGEGREGEGRRTAGWVLWWRCEWCVVLLGRCWSMFVI
jgi:hypothetical protein